MTPDPRNPGKFLRDHHKPGNQEQHQAFLDVVEGTHLQKEITDWFRTLPLWLDLGLRQDVATDGVREASRARAPDSPAPGECRDSTNSSARLRIVHACWHQPFMDRLLPLMGPNQTLTNELILLGSQKGHWVHEAIEAICKGPEVDLPEGISFQDKEGKVRHEVRVRWWLPEVRTFREAGIVPPGSDESIPDIALPAKWVGHAYSGPPVVFGHYWFTGEPVVISKKFACVDYSAAKAGPLVAYRWDGQTELSSEKLAWV